jgi:hypothetical protein
MTRDGLVTAADLFAERPLDPPENDIDYDRTEELIEQERADDVDRAWESEIEKISADIDRQFREIARGQK